MQDAYRLARHGNAAGTARGESNPLRRGDGGHVWKVNGHG